MYKKTNQQTTTKANKNNKVKQQKTHEKLRAEMKQNINDDKDGKISNRCLMMV